MKVYAQFITLSSGLTWKEGKMVEVPKEPIDALGSDGVFILDGRNCLPVMISDARDRMDKLKNVKDYIGFKIVKGSRFTEQGTILYNSLK